MYQKWTKARFKPWNESTLSQFIIFIGTVHVVL